MKVTIVTRKNVVGEPLLTTMRSDVCFTPESARETLLNHFLTSSRYGDIDELLFTVEISPGTWIGFYPIKYRLQSNMCYFGIYSTCGPTFSAYANIVDLLQCLNDEKHTFAFSKKQAEWLKGKEV